MPIAVRYETAMVIQCANGFTKTGRVAKKSQTIKNLRHDVTKEDILVIVPALRNVLATEILSIKLVQKKITTVMGAYTRKEEKEEIVSEREIMAQEGVQESMPAAAAQVRQVQSTPAIIGDVEYAATNGIDFPGLSNEAVNTDAPAFGAGAVRIEGLEKLGIFNFADLHRNPLAGTTTEIGYVPPISAADAPLYGLPPLPPGGL